MVGPVTIAPKAKLKIDRIAAFVVRPENWLSWTDKVHPKATGSIYAINVGDIRYTYSCRMCTEKHVHRVLQLKGDKRPGRSVSMGLASLFGFEGGKNVHVDVTEDCVTLMQIAQVLRGAASA